MFKFRIKVIRVAEYNNSTFGELHINNNFFCYTLENRKTLIKEGVYNTNLHYGTRWESKSDRDCIAIKVPDRIAILIHPANWVINPKTKKESLKGCISLGDKYDLKKEYLGNSKNTLTKFIKEVGYKFEIKIENKLNNNKKMINTLAMLAAKKLGLKAFEYLKGRAKIKAVSIVKNKLEKFNIKNEKDLDNLDAEKIQELRKEIIESNNDLRRAELNYLSHTSDYTTKSWKDEFIVIFCCSLIASLVIIGLYDPSKSLEISNSVEMILTTPFGFVFVAAGLEAVGCRHILTKVAETLTKKYLS
jgi:hypothetical protein